MRVTQSMMSSSSLRYLSQSYKTLLELQNQLSTGKKITRASQDPVIAMNGMRYRSQVTEIEQFDRNLSEVYNWMDNADATLDKVGETLQRIRELAVQVSNDTYEETQRGNVAKEVDQLLEHLISLANTRSNNKYIFNGTNTTNPPVDATNLFVSFDDLEQRLNGMTAIEEIEYEITYDGNRYVLDTENSDLTQNTFVFRTAGEEKTITINTADDTITYVYEDEEGEEVSSSLDKEQLVVVNKNAVSTNDYQVEIELLKGVHVPVNITPSNVFSTEFFGVIKQFSDALKNSDTTAENLTGFIDNIDTLINKVVDERAELGARYNRVEMIEDRVKEQEVIAKRIMSDNEDADIAEVITELLTAENVHRANLATMARIMQPTLMDFLR